MKDFLGVQLKIGDWVVYHESASSFVKAEVVGFTPKKIDVKPEKRHNRLKFPEQLISIEANREVYPELFL